MVRGERIRGRPRQTTWGLCAPVAGLLAVALLTRVRTGSSPIAPTVPPAETHDSNVTAVPDISLARLLGCNAPAGPPITFQIGSGPHDPNAPDLETPSAALFSALDLHARGRSAHLGDCFTADANDAGACTRLWALADPELVDLTEDEREALAVWQARSSAPLTWQGRTYGPGTIVRIETGLCREDDLWRIARPILKLTPVPAAEEAPHADTIP